jgi:hypothetical protein
MSKLTTHCSKLLILLLLSVIVSCGGGGGGGAPSPTNSSAQLPTKPSARTGLESVSVDASPINIKYIYGNEQAIIGTTQGQNSLTRKISVSGIDLDQLPDNFALGYVADDESTFKHISINLEKVDKNKINAKFRPISRLSPGEYTGSVQLIACFANANFDDCEDHLIGSPSAKLAYKINVFPQLILFNQSSSVFVNQSSNATITGDITINGVISKEDLAAQISYSANATNWLSLTKTNDGYTYSVRAPNAPLGNHSAVVKITSLASNQTVTKTIALTVGENGFSGIQELAVFNITDQTTIHDLKSEFRIALSDENLSIPWKATSNVPWIIFDKSSGVTGESVIYRIALSHVASMPTETYLEPAGNTATITISNLSTLTIAPVTLPIEVHRFISQVEKQVSAPTPVNYYGYPLYFQGKNIESGTILETSGPSPFVLTNDGTIQTVPTIAGNYIVRTKNALGIQTQPMTVTFLANSNHGYSFISTQGYKRSMAYDQTRDTLYVVDKTNQQLSRFRYSNNNWISDRLSSSTISDIGLSKDRNRLYASHTNGTIKRINTSNLTVENSYPYGKPFPEYKRLSQNLPVQDIGEDIVSVLTDYSSQSQLIFSGIVNFTSNSNTFAPVSGYGHYKPEQGGWFAPSQNPNIVYFTQAPPRLNDFGTYAGLLIGNRLAPSAFALITYAGLAPFDRLDIGQTNDAEGFGLVDRARFTSKRGYSAELPAISSNYRAIGSVVSADWKYIYLLAYPTASINGDAPTTLKPRVFVYQLTSDYFPSVALLDNYFDFDNFPTCRRESDVTCMLDTLSSSSLDGRTLFFAGDKGIAVVPVPSTLRSNSTILSTRKVDLLRNASKNQLMNSSSNVRAKFKFVSN